MKHQKGLSAQDRSARSRLRQLLDRADGFIHGSMIRMARRCGNPRCHCAVKDELHVSWCLGVTEKCRSRMKHIPKVQESTVRRWVRQYQDARRLLDLMSQEAWQRLDKDKE
jgi:hypothetical protein